MIRSLNSWLFAGAGWLLAVPVLPAQEPIAVPPPPQVQDEFAELITRLDQLGLHIDAAVARQAALEALIQTADPQGRFLTAAEAEQLRQNQQGKIQDIGVRISMTNGMPIVVEVRDGSPAQTASIHVGDRLMKINDQDSSRTDIATVGQALQSATSSTLRVVILTADGSTNDLAVPTSLMQELPVETAEKLPAALSYLKVNGFYKGSASPIASKLKEWRDEQRFGIVLDLRGAGGMDLDAVAEISGLFGPVGSFVFSLRDSRDQDLAVYKASAGEPLGMPTMVLVDERTTGAAEVLAASLKRSIRGAMLLGEPTGGDPAIREIVTLSADRQAYLATRKLVTEDGSVYDGRQGVAPDILVAPRATDFTDYEPELVTRKREPLQEELEDQQLHTRVKGDPALRRAVDILLGLKALDIRGFQYPETISN